MVLGEAKLEIRSRDIEGTSWFGKISEIAVPQHLFIIHTDSTGKETILRGGPEKGNMVLGNLRIVKTDYGEGVNNGAPSIDFIDSSPSQIIASGSDAEMQAYFDKMWEKGQEINSHRYDYKLPTGCSAALAFCHVQNSNTVVKAMVEAAGLEVKLPLVNGEPAWVPGFDGEFKHTQFDRFLKKVETTFQAETNFSFIVQDGELPTQSGVQFNLTVGDSIKSILQLFGTARNPIDPVVFDLTGKGLQLVDVDASTVRFDFVGEGFANKAGWVSENEAFLAIDRNNNGRIDNITELFGNQTISGVKELALYDSNRDNIISNEDEIFDKLLIWQDADGNGITNPNELKCLGEVGINKINLKYNNVSYSVARNLVQQQFSYFMQEGEGGEYREFSAYDISFLMDLTDTVHMRGLVMNTEKQLESALVALLRGYGKLPSLEYKMSEDGELFTLVRDVIEMIDKKHGSLNEEIFKIINKWAELEKVEVGSRGDEIDAKQLDFLETVTGHNFTLRDGNTSPTPQAAHILREAWNIASSDIKAKLLIQGPLKEVFNVTYYDYSSDKIKTNDSKLKVEPFVKIVESMQPQDKLEAISLWNNVYEVASTIGIFDKEETGQFTMEYLAHIANILSLDYSLLENKNIFLTKVGQKNIHTSEYRHGEVAIGDYRSNVINTGWGNDILIGLSGNDVYMGGADSDTYVWIPAFGSIIIDEVQDRHENDVLYIADRISPVQLSFLGNGTDGSLDIIHVRTNTKVHIKGHYRGYDVETLRFLSGYETSLHIGAKFEGTDLADKVVGSSHDDDIVGSKGDDVLLGGGGDDNYIWDLGDGNDVIDEKESDSNYDRLCFGKGISFEDLKLHINSEGNMVIDIYSCNGSITVNNQVSTKSAVEILEFSDNSMMLLDSVSVPVFGTNSSETLKGTAHNDYMFGFGGDDELFGNDGHDHLYGGAGNDKMHGGGGDDVYYWKSGNDTIYETYGGGYDILDIQNYPKGGIIFTAYQRDIIIFNSNFSESIKIVEYGDNRHDHKIEMIRYKDSSNSDLSKVGFIRYGTDLNDEEYLSNNGDTVHISKGRDKYHSGEGIDRFIVRDDVSDCDITEIRGFDKQRDKIILQGIKSDTLFSELFNAEGSNLNLVYGNCSVNIYSVEINGDYAQIIESYY